MSAVKLSLIILLITVIVIVLIFVHFFVSVAIGHRKFDRKVQELERENFGGKNTSPRKKTPGHAAEDIDIPLHDTANKPRPKVSPMPMPEPVPSPLPTAEPMPEPDDDPD